MLIDIPQKFQGQVHVFNPGPTHPARLAVGSAQDSLDFRYFFDYGWSQINRDKGANQGDSSKQALSPN